MSNVEHELQRLHPFSIQTGAIQSTNDFVQEYTRLRFLYIVKHQTTLEGKKTTTTTRWNTYMVFLVCTVLLTYQSLLGSRSDKYHVSIKFIQQVSCFLWMYTSPNNGVLTGPCFPYPSMTQSHNLYKRNPIHATTLYVYLCAQKR